MKHERALDSPGNTKHEDDQDEDDGEKDEKKNK
jgi:hypothetical protein